MHLYYMLLLYLAMPYWQAAPEDRAIAYLSREVPAWSRDNKCFSCHNNGDGARALYIARSMSYAVPDAALADTTVWLKSLDEWDNSGQDAGFSDKRLARIEFSNALLEAVNAGIVSERTLLRNTGEALVLSQDTSGAWTVDAESLVATPARYGPVLATYMARRVLEETRDPKFHEAIGRANSFLVQAPLTTVMNAAAVAMALAVSSDSQAKARTEEAVQSIISAQASDGGWGPYARTPTEVFDTAIALLALASLRNRPEVDAAVRRGRDYLIKMQLDDGSWIETTRPSGGRSYAQHISTCGWATIALLKTSGR